MHLLTGQPASAGDSQGRARLKNSSRLKIIKYLNGQWKPWLLLTGTFGQTKPQKK
jgi:hypothetical protein